MTETTAPARALNRPVGARGRTTRRVLVRLVTSIGVLWGAATLTFFTLRLIPGDPAYAIVGGPEANPSPAVLDQVRAEYGLDDPWYAQYFAYLGRLLQGDLGTSYRLHMPVAQAISEQIQATLWLAGAAAFLAVLLSVVVATLTAHRGRFTRGASSAGELILASMPSFWLGILLLTVFSFGLHWFPAIGTNGWGALVLPAVTLALPIAAVLTQVLRNALEEVLEQPFVTTARARGMGEASVRLRHALRHALVPLATMSGYLVGGLLGGAVITESLFNRQGLGRLLLTAVSSKDMPVVLGLVLLSALVYVVVNLLVDLSYPLIDPRLRSPR